MITILHDEKAGKAESTIKPTSKIIKKVLDVMKGHGYISGYEEVEDGRGNSLKITLSGNINKCGVIKPRFSVGKDGFESFEEKISACKKHGYLNHFNTARDRHARRSSKEKHRRQTTCLLLLNNMAKEKKSTNSRN